MRLIARRLCLDFVNTVGGRVSRRTGGHLRDYADGVVQDRIAGYEDLLAWSRLAGSIPKNEASRLRRRAALHPRDAAAALARAVDLREALYRIFKSCVEGWPPRQSDIDTLRAELSIARSHERLARSAGNFVWLWEDQRHPLDRVLWPVSRSAADMLTSADLSRIRQCERRDCGGIFLDTTRNRSRRWCDLCSCGRMPKPAKTFCAAAAGAQFV
jgi:predicted RNA-binding Zn ribbon-like protein